MSASREKKNRQELAGSGIPDIREIRAEEERKKQRRTNRMYAAIAIIFVVVAAALLVWNSNIIQRSSTAVTVDGEEYSAAEVGYFYHSAYNGIVNSQAGSYLGIDPQKPLKEQEVSEMAGMLGIQAEEGMTWDDYFRKAAKDQLVQLTALKRGAAEAEFEFTDAMQAEVDQTLEQLSSTAKQAGMSAKAYLKAVFGPNMTMGVFKDILHDSIWASEFAADHQDNLKYSDSEIEKYYQKNKDQFDVVSYDTIFFNGAAEPTKDDKGESVPPTEEENKKASKAAKEAAEEALSQVQAGGDMEAIAKDYKMASFSSKADATNYGDEMSKWLFDKDRTEGETGLVESNGSYYVVTFHERGRNDYNTVNVRHILKKLDTTGLDPQAEDYKDKVEELKKTAKAEADKVLQEWKDGAATEESFAELANKNSDDGGSNTKGGLYEQVPKGQMVPAFNDWIFDKDRQVGDTDILFVDAGNYMGYHVMYFCGEDAPYWTVQVRGTMSQKDQTEWNESLMKDLKAEDASGMKYVG